MYLIKWPARVMEWLEVCSLPAEKAGKKLIVFKQTCRWMGGWIEESERATEQNRTSITAKMCVLAGSTMCGDVGGGGGDTHFPCRSK